MRALISVSDKTGVVEFARELRGLDYEIISTGGTFELLKKNGIDVFEIDKITKFPECFDGRVKTLNPYIHGGILYRRDIVEHIDEAKKLSIDAIDLICVNLYPFKETIRKTDNFEKIIENIDIGGPAMLRSGAKNFHSVTVVSDILDYNLVIDALKTGDSTVEFRRNLMIKAYEHTASYDSMIANYMNKRFNKGFGETQFIVGKKVFDTRYGENPHQSGALYEFDDFFTKNFKALKGEASFNNMNDINGAMKIASSFGEVPAVCIVKHANPCGFSIGKNLLDSYEKALECDNVSAFGGVVAVNGKVNKALADKINEIFIEVIIAASIDDDALAVFAQKKRIKIFIQDRKFLTISEDKYDFKHIDGGFVYQNSDIVKDDELKSAVCKTKKEATAKELNDLEIAIKISAFTKSNCIVYVKNSTMVAIGMGMTSRIDAAKSALRKAKEMNLDIKGSSMASEAFFPFKDSIDEAAKAGVSSIAQPGGSIRDNEIVEAANKHDIALYFTSVRHFLH